MITQLKGFSTYMGTSTAIKEANDFLLKNPNIIIDNIKIAEDFLILIYKYDTEDAT